MIKSITNHKDGSFERLPGESLTEWTQRWLAARQEEALWFNYPALMRAMKN